MHAVDQGGPGRGPLFFGIKQCPGTSVNGL